MKNEYDVAVEWLPFELHPEIPPEGWQLPWNVRAQFGGMSERLRQMAHEAGMEMVIPDLIPNSRRALEASEYARENGVHEAFHQAVFRKFYGEGQDMNDWPVLRAAAVETGLHPDEMQQHTTAGRFQPIVEGHHNRALQMGITGVPAFIFNQQYAILGAQPYEVFQQAMARLTGIGLHDA